MRTSTEVSTDAIYSATDEAIGASCIKQTKKRNVVRAMKPLWHLVFAVFMEVLAMTMMMPPMVDVTIGALCPQHNQCNEAIYISGFQQSVTGFGKIVATPLIGQLSDEYGRKPLLLISLSISIFPFALLAYSRARSFVYTYYVLRTLVAIVAEGTIFCVSMACVADVMEESLRANAFGIMTGIWAIAFIIGTVFSRALPLSQVFLVGCILLAIGALYANFFFCESNTNTPEASKNMEEGNVIKKKTFLRSESTLMHRWSSIKETIHVVRVSQILTQITVIAFFSTLGASGMASVILYYFKAIFSFNKNDFAYLMLIFGISAIVAQLVLLPLLIHFLGEKQLLCLALFASVIMELLLASSWSPWIPYLCAVLGAVYLLVFPCASSIVSKAAGQEEQGRVQGFVAGIQSFASTLSPLAMSPLTALFLSEDAPFNFHGFSMICSAIAMMIAFIQACLIQSTPPPIAGVRGSEYVQVFSSNDVGQTHIATDS